MSLIVRSICLPCSVKGLTVPDDAGDYNIYINTQLNYETQRKALKHEVEHIKNDHFYSTRPVSFLENEINGD
jgi:hypothetical protein